MQFTEGLVFGVMTVIGNFVTVFLASALVADSALHSAGRKPTRPPVVRHQQLSSLLYGCTQAKDEHGVSPGAAFPERPGYPGPYSGGAGSTEWNFGSWVHFAGVRSCHRAAAETLPEYGADP
ncbi:hypothetical protein CF319_g7910 [Tilletia indica]|nr:hypothetical protein CF319_g7910 [Tilletia indica]